MLHILQLAVLLINYIHTGQASCDNGALRLTGDGAAGYVASGTVEICINNQWGNICASDWTTMDAQVVCKQLGYSSNGAVALSNGVYSSNVIHLYDVNCNGNEHNLFQCNTSGFGNCTNKRNIVAVACQGLNFTCQDGEVRLIGGTHSNEGRIEVCSNNRYGTVCDDQWNNVDANVVCHQLGFANEGAIALDQAIYGEGIGSVYLTDVNCNGNEHNITECSHNAEQIHCTHSEDASVICKPMNPDCTDGQVRLANGRTPNEGRVEVCYNGVWGTVCHDLWDDTDAAIVCSQLGYTSEGAKAVKFADFGQGEGPILLDNVQCKGSEHYLNECLSNSLGSHNCRHNKDAGVICQDPTVTCDNGAIRLVGGETANEGRVEICYNNHYGTVCEDQWTHEDAQVTCRQLGYNAEGSIAVRGNQYGPGVGLIYLDDLECSGTESSLLDCEHRGLSVSNCYHHQDAAVICKNNSMACEHGSVRLVNGTLSSEGRVEVCVNGIWSPICDSDWTQQDANVICNQLGYNGNNALPISDGYYSLSEGPTLLSSIACTGTEDNILHCINSSYIGSQSCNDDNHVGVVCPLPAENTTCKNGDVRLMDGGKSNQGRVEICYNGIWGSICDDSWDNGDASVVCKQLGYNLTLTRSIPTNADSFGISNGPILMNNINCYGVESNILQCSTNNHGNSKCTSRNVGVVCSAIPCNENDLRLTEGTNDREGILEVCKNGVWTRVCTDDYTTNVHSEQLCSYFGYSSQGSFSKAGLFRSSKTLSKTLSVSTKDCDNIVNCLTKNVVTSINKCSTNEMIGIVCSDTNSKQCLTGDIRLRGGGKPTEGRVEVCVGGQWGTVCDDSWDDKSSSVVCNQLGYPSSNAKGIRGGHYGTGSGNILLDNVQCQGNESQLLNCYYNSLRSHNCHHKEDAAVKCEEILHSETTTSSSSMGATKLVPTNPGYATGSMNDKNISTDTTIITIPVVSLLTVCILSICLTIIFVVMYKWKKLKVISKCQNINVIHATMSSSIESSPPPEHIV